MAGPDYRSRTPTSGPLGRRHRAPLARRRCGVGAHLLVALLVLAAASAAGAQTGRAQPFEPWRLTGDLFLSYDRLNSQRDDFEAAHNSSLGLGFDLNLHGFAFDPRFLTFDIGGGFQAIGNDVNGDDFSTRITGYRVIAQFLRERPWPLTVSLIKSGNGNRSDREGRYNTQLDFLTLGLNWRLVLPDKPNINVNYDRSSSSSEFIAPGLRGTESRVRTLSVNVFDRWKEWDLSGRFFDTASGRELATDVTTETARKRLSLSSMRPFDNANSLFQVTADYFSGSDALDDAFAGRNEELFVSSTLAVQHTPKLSGNYFYGFRYAELDFLVDEGLAATRTFSSHDAGAQLRYQLTDKLALLGSTSASLIPVAQTDAIEEARALYRLGPGVSYQHPFRYFAFGASYEAIWNAMETTLDQLSAAWSHVITLNASGGDRRVLQVTALYQYSDVAQVTFLGSFNRQKRFRLTFESQALRPLTVRAGVTLNEYDVLNINGENVADGNSWDVGIEHPKFSAGLGRRRGFGESFAFATPAERGGRLVDPLPIDTLLTSPFAARDSLQDFAYLTVRPTFNLRVTARWRKENTFFTLTPDFFTEEWNLIAEYQLQRFRFTGGYLAWDILTGPQRLQTRRLYFRVSRSLDFLPFS